jgi:Leucine-rich repeat (LRR) protein
MSELARKLIAENVAKRERGEDASYLDLGRCGLRELPEELGQCVWLEVLVLSDKWDEWEAETGVWKTQHSQNQGEANRLYKLDGVERLEGLNKLFSGGDIMNSWPLHDLSPLAKLQSLQSLDCRLTEVQDLSPLAALHKLQFLNCSHTKVQDLNPLSGLQNLQILECRNKQVQDLSPLSNLDNLRSLNCSDTQIKDLSLVSNMKKLQSLSFWNTLVQDLSPLSGLQNLKSLYCHMTRVVDLSPLSGLQSLQSLNCSSSKVQDLSPLAELQNLEWLICSDTQIQDLSPLSTLQNLRLLICSHTQIQDLSPLSSLQNLQSLNFDRTQIIDLSPLAGLQKLQSLQCSFTQVQDLSPLAELQKLQSLYCWGTQVQDLSPLVGLQNLQELHCSGTQVQDLSPLVGLQKLHSLLCTSTQLSNVYPLIQILSLNNFDVDDCPIEDCPADIYQQKNITLLREYFEQNPPADVPRQSPKDARRDVKLVLLGNSAAGKTSLLHYLKTGVFLEERNSTHGLEIHRWLPDEGRFPRLSDIAVSIWDFGGQEYYHDAYRLFMSDNAVYLLLWEAETNCNGRRPTCLHSGEEEKELEHFEIKYWLDTIRHYGGEAKDTPLLVVQNKTDRPKDKKRLDQALHDEFGIRESLHISLKEGCKNPSSREGALLRYFEAELAQVLTETADKVSLGEEWLKIRQSILDFQEGEKGSLFYENLSEDGSILLKDFEKVATKVIGKPTGTSPDTLPNIFKRGGVVVFFPKSERIGNRVFLQPTQLADKIYHILKKQVLELGGEFDPTQVFEGNDGFKNIFLEVALNLDLIFRHPQRTGWFIAPQYLPASHPIEDLFRIAAHGAWQSAFCLRVPLFYYKKLLHNLVLHFAADSLTEARHFWKHGIVFLKNDLRVLIKGLYPAENEQDGVILVGIEPDVNGRHLVLQKKIFDLCFNFLTNRKTTISVVKKTVSLKSEIGQIEKDFEQAQISPLDDQEKFDHTSRSMAPDWLEVSTENTFFVKYKDLLAAAKREEVKIEGKNKAGETSKLLMQSFKGLLPYPPRRAKRVFVSYSHQNTHWLNRLRAHLGGLRRSKHIETWTDQELPPGELWDKAIREKLSEADVFILLLSADFTSSEYIWDTEWKIIFDKYSREQKTIIPVWVEPLDLLSLPGIEEVLDGDGKMQDLKIQDFSIIPKDSDGRLKAISLWSSQEEALATVVAKIREAVTKSPHR